LHRDLKS